MLSPAGLSNSQNRRKYWFSLLPRILLILPSSYTWQLMNLMAFDFSRRRSQHRDNAESKAKKNWKTNFDFFFFFCVFCIELPAELELPRENVSSLNEAFKISLFFARPVSLRYHSHCYLEWTRVIFPFTARPSHVMFGHSGVYLFHFCVEIDFHCNIRPLIPKSNNIVCRYFMQCFTRWDPQIILLFLASAYSSIFCRLL